MDRQTEALERLRNPSTTRAAVQVLGLGASLAALWLASWQLRDPYNWMTLVIAVPAGAVTVGLFNVMHDCAHLSFLRSRAANLLLGRSIGLLTLTPFDYWRRAHMLHHGRSGNLGRRGIQDVDTLTVGEFLALPRYRQWLYRAYRHPLLLIFLGGPFLFLIQYRFPIGVPADRHGWTSTQITNLALVGCLALIAATIDIGDFLAVHGPIFLVSTWIGVWLYYEQHQFENTYWEHDPEWSHHQAAIRGSSHLQVPLLVRCALGDSGFHDLHHLHPRIPSYHLRSAARACSQLAGSSRLSLSDALRATRLAVWDEHDKRMVTFRDALSSGRAGTI